MNKPQLQAVITSLFLMNFVVGCGANVNQADAPLPTSPFPTHPIENTVSAIPGFVPTPSVIDRYQEAISIAMGAETITETALSKDDWNSVVSMWQQSISLLESVPQTSPNYTLAINKIKEYKSSLNLAQQKALKLAYNPNTIDSESNPTSTSPDTATDSESNPTPTSPYSIAPSFQAEVTTDCSYGVCTHAYTAPNGDTDISSTGYGQSYDVHSRSYESNGRTTLRSWDSEGNSYSVDSYCDSTGCHKLMCI